MKRILPLLFALLLLPVLSFAAPDDLVAFKLYVPEDPIYQGDRIMVRYVLDARQYSVKRYDGGMEGAVLESLDSRQGESGVEHVHRLIVEAVFRITGAGDLLVRPMSAMIGEEQAFSDSVRIHVLPHPEYGAEWETARAFLLSQGAAGDALGLAYKYGSKALCAFSNPDNESFAIVARQDYQPYLENPILAFGLGNAMWSGNGKDDPDNSVYHILSRYETQLESLRRDRETYRAQRPSDYEPDPAGVAPLLGDIAFGQGSPYNALLPSMKLDGRDSTCLAGCGPVALAQILAYYHSSTQPQGTHVFTTKDGKEHRVNFKSHPLRWDGSEKDLSALLLDCAGSVGADLSPTKSGSSLINFKAALLDNWGYSPTCTLIEKYPDAAMLSMLYRELDEGRPVIVADEAHMFVVDGYYQDFLHMNLGWKGYCNGYYRVLVVPSRRESQLPFTQMLVGIQPLRSSDMRAAKINVRKPGTLAKLLSERQQRELTKLTVSGKINGEDIELLCNMAGATYRLGDIEHGHGSLMELDLSKATIVGGEPYAYRFASATTISGTIHKNGEAFNYRYDLSNISKKDWNTIVEWGIDKNKDFGLGYTDDGQIYIVFMAKDNIVGAHMFDRCENLRAVWLPKKATAVEKQAFFECRALERVYNLPRGKVDDDAFKACPRLREKK